MAWNDNMNPNPNQPPDLDEVINKLKEKFSGFGMNNRNRKRKPINSGPIIKFVIIIITLVWLGSGFYIVDEGWRGVVFRFGKFQEITNSGPHWHLPYPIETHNTIYTDRSRSESIGFRNIRNQNRQFVGNVSSESLMLTKDENIIDAKFEVQYRIKNVTDYLFNVLEPEQTLGQVVQSAIRLVAGRNNMDYILTGGRSDIVARIEENAQSLLDSYGTGLVITAVNMRDAQAPEPVQAAFSDVVKSREDKERLVNEAETYANGILPQARGEAARILEEAKAYRAQVTAKAEGEANRFNQVRTEYEKAPEVTKERLYLEVIESVLAKTSKIVVDSNSNNVMYLPLDRLGLGRDSQIREDIKQQSPKGQSNQSNRTGNIRNAFRNREVR